MLHHSCAGGLDPSFVEVPAFGGISMALKRPHKGMEMGCNLLNNEDLTPILTFPRQGGRDF